MLSWTWRRWVKCLFVERMVVSELYEITFLKYYTEHVAKICMVRHSSYVSCRCIFPKTLAYVVVLELDFIFFSGLQINVIDRKCSFKSKPQEDHPFLPGNPSVPDINPQSQKTKQHVKMFNQKPLAVEFYSSTTACMPIITTSQYRCTNFNWQLCEWSTLTLCWKKKKTDSGVEVCAGQIF